MGERSSSHVSSSSTLSTKSVARTLGRVVPSFGRAIPSTTAPPSSVHSSLPPLSSISPSIPTTSKVMDETKNLTVPLVSNHHQITPNLSLLSSQHNKIHPSSLSQPEVECQWTDDTIISVSDEYGKVVCEKEIRCNGLNGEKIVSKKQENDKKRMERKSVMKWPDMLISSEEKETREEGNFLLLEVSDSVDICELMMHERTSDGPIQEFDDQEKEGVDALLRLMIKGGSGPVKISEWADEVNIDEYYLKTYAREVCEMLLPKKILKIKDGNFVMGDTLAEYLHLFKVIYTQEVMVMLNRGDTISGKTISEDLGIYSLMDSLAMEWSSTVFIVEKKRGDTYVTMRL